MPLIDEEAPHIAAIKSSVLAGFRFLHLRAGDGAAVTAIHAERRRNGAVDSFTVQHMTEAIASRFRLDEYPCGDPLWQEHGTVADVVTALLNLPPHGAPGAPTLTRRTSSSLWLPGNT